MASTPSSDRSLPPSLRDPSRRTVVNNILNDSVTWLKHSHETNGEYTLARVLVKPGNGPPMHYNGSWNETFKCLSGRLTIVKDSETLYLNPGDTTHVAKGVNHQFVNETDSDVEFEGRITPGHEGFEKCMYVLYGLANDGLANKDGIPTSIISVSAMSDLSDMKFAGVTGVAMNVAIAAVAAYARASGTEKELLEKYWYS